MQTEIHFAINWWDVVKIGGGFIAGIVVFLGVLAWLFKDYTVFNP